MAPEAVKELPRHVILSDSEGSPLLLSIKYRDASRSLPEAPSLGSRPFAAEIERVQHDSIRINHSFFRRGPNDDARSSGFLSCQPFKSVLAERTQKSDAAPKVEP